MLLNSHFYENKKGRSSCLFCLLYFGLPFVFPVPLSRVCPLRRGRLTVFLRSLLLLLSFQTKLIHLINTVSIYNQMSHEQIPSTKYFVIILYVYSAFFLIG